MSAIAKLAAALKERKGITTQTATGDPAPPPAPPTHTRGPKGKHRRRPRYSASQYALVRLETRLRAAQKRIEELEAELAQVNTKEETA